MKVYLLVQGRQFAAPLRCRLPASGVSGGGCYATGSRMPSELDTTFLWMGSVRNVHVERPIVLTTI